MKRATAVLFTALLALSGQSLLAQSDDDAIRQLMADLTAAFSSGDVDGLMAFYADDAIQFPDAAPAVEGRAALRADGEAFAAANTVSSEAEVQELEVLGDLAWVRLTYHDATTPKDSGKTTDTYGNWLLVLRREGDGWKVTHEIWNLTHPPGQPPG